MQSNGLVVTRRRLIAVLLIVCTLFLALGVRLFVVQILDGKELRTKAAEQWYRDLPLGAQRGIIYDATGEVLADNYDVYSIYVRPAAVTDVGAVAAVLGETLGLDPEKLKEKITAKRVSEITVLRGVDAEKAEKIRAHNLAGIYFTADSKRNYPYGNNLSQILGFTNIDNVGQNGLEGYYDKYLRGVDGYALTATDIKGKETGDSIRYVPSIPGCNMTLTIDTHIQAFAENAVGDACAEWNAKGAYMVVMDVNTGAIKAMASAPGYDNNDPPRDDMTLLNALSKNKMIVDVYEPGSTFKIFTTAAALENGNAHTSDRFFCPGYRIVDGQRIKCWRTIGHGSQDLAEGVMNSCNCVFMDLAGRLGTGNFYDYLETFGFGQKTGVDFYGESRGLLMNEASVKPVDLARIGFGQAVAVTPLQLITGVSAVINGGTLYQPYFVASVDDYAGKNVYTRQPVAVRRVLKEETSATMRTLLENVVSKGGGKKAGVAGYRIGGKTGTAQKYENGAIARGKYVSSFIGFAPVENPQYAVLMVVDEPTGYVYYGSLTAAPYAGRVFERIFAYTGLAPSVAEEKPTTFAMPDLIGKSVEDAVKILHEYGLQFETAGEGNRVIATLPAPNGDTYAGDVVLIRVE